ncbi:MAG: 6-carboxytetrahydropterin synthase [Planctomycetota bacterium]|nr:MAG: 6-carboxytetrahydropterin synthase [Planctomycetota bacterium]
MAQESWSIEVDKEYLKFSAAHFLIFPDGSAERLHGHNYRVYFRLRAALSPFGLVMDFQMVKPVIRELVEELDEHWLVPAQHPELHIRERDRSLEIQYRDRLYMAPKDDIILLPINNTSAENLSSWIGRELHRRLQSRFPDVALDELWVAVEETPGQRGSYRFTRD